MALSEFGEAIRRLDHSPDYKIVCQWLEKESKEMTQLLLTAPATDEAFVLLGQARALDYILKTLRASN